MKTEAQIRDLLKEVTNDIPVTPQMAVAMAAVTDTLKWVLGETE